MPPSNALSPEEQALQVRFVDVRAQIQGIELQKEIISFWMGQRAVLPQQAQERAGKVIHVARNLSDHQIVGEITASLLYVDSMQLPFWNCRGSVTQDVRSKGLITALCRSAFLSLNADFVSGQDTRAVGMFLDIENQQLKQRNAAVWEDHANRIAFVYIGQKPNGNHIRIAYFHGAQVDNNAT